MSKRYRDFSLVNASEARRQHVDDAALPRVVDIKNMYLSKSDKVPTLRGDLTPGTANLKAYENDLSGTPTGIEDYMNTSLQVRGEKTLHFSTMVPFEMVSGSPVLKMFPYQIGAVSGTNGTSVITGVNTNWLRYVWAGCFIEEDDGSLIYQIASVDSDTQVTINGTLEATIPGSTTYKIYYAYHNSLATYPLNIQEKGNAVLVSAVDPTQLQDEEYLAGPLQHKVTTRLNWTWAELAEVGDKIWFENSVWFNAKTSQLRYVTDPAGSWSNATDAVITAEHVAYDGTTFAAIEANGTAIWESPTNDATGSWLSRTALPGVGYAFASNGAGQWMFSSHATGRTYVSSDLTGAWTDLLTNNSQLYWDAIYWDYLSLYVLVGANGTMMFNSAGGGLQRKELKGISLLSAAQGGANNRILVAVGSSREKDTSGYLQYSGVIYYYDYATQDWVNVIIDLPNELQTVEWSGSYFIATAVTRNPADPLFYYSQDGRTWSTAFADDLLELLLDNNEQITRSGCIPSNAAMTNCLVAGNAIAQPLIYGTASSPVESLEIFKAHPVSDLYRSASFSLIDNYFIMVGMREWNAVADRWDYFPDRARWPKPGTLTDFTGAGGTYIDCRGMGAIFDCRPVNHSLILFGSGGIGLLNQVGTLDNPWGYKSLRKDLRLRSNPLVLNNVAYFIGIDGRMWQATESVCRQIGDFDLSKFDDFDTTTPVSLDFDHNYGTFVVKLFTSTSPHRIFLISEETGAVSHFEVPEFTTGAVTYKPKHVSVARIPGSDYMHVHYEAIAANAADLISPYIELGAAITGIDTPVSGSTVRWWARITGGNDRVSKDGHRANISDMEMDTYTDGTVYPDVIVEVRGPDDASWDSLGDGNGTITITGAACTGSDTAWSNLLKAGDDTAAAVTTPCTATQARYYEETAGTYTLWVLGTDYTITDTKEITPASALASGTDLYAYWDAYPLVRAKAGDYIYSQTDEQFHRITSVTTATAAALESYASASQTGSHYTAEQMPSGDSWLVIGVASQVNEIRWRITIVPRNDASSSTIAKVVSFLLRYTSAGPEMRKD